MLETLSIIVALAVLCLFIGAVVAPLIRDGEAEAPGPDHPSDFDPEVELDEWCCGDTETQALRQEDPWEDVDPVADGYHKGHE